MSGEQFVMRLEYLPNEILIECFQYLNTLDMFYSFDQLNYRFYKLIRTIPLHLDFQDVSKSIFDQFCHKILSSLGLQRHIYSLKLSNDGGYGQIHRFLSLFSFDEFPHLHSLTLIQIEHDEMKVLKEMLTLIHQLLSFYSIESEQSFATTLTKDPIYNLRALSATQSLEDRDGQVIFQVNEKNKL